MGNRSYTAEHHKRAFDIYYETRTYRRVTDELSLDYGTIVRWASAEYRCRFNCPYHNWEALLAEKERAVKAKIRLYEEHEFNPILHDEAVRGAVPATVPDDGTVAERHRAEELTAQRRNIVDKLVRSDVERLAQWEMLWSKAMYHATGQVLDFEALVDPEGNPLSEDDLKTLYKQGLKFGSLDAGIRCLTAIQDQIEKVKDRIGLRRKLGGEDEEQTKNGHDRPRLTLDDMRRFRDLLENTPPEQQALLMKLMRADDRAFQLLDQQGQVVNGQGSSTVPPTT